MSLLGVRMGLRFVKGLGEVEGGRVEESRAAGPFRSVANFAERTHLEKYHLTRLAEAGALESLVKGRRDALWEVRGLDAPAAPRFDLQTEERPVAFAPLSLFENIAWDYTASEHSARGHPLAPLRMELASQELIDARTLNGLPHGRRVRYAGLAVSRQQPATAKGVVFMTLEDETGFVNVVLWRKIFDHYRTIAKTVPFLGVTGRLEVEEGVTHLVAEALWVPEIHTKPRGVKSRDFR